MKGSIFLKVAVFCVLLTLLAPVSPALADPPVLSLDLDGDGLPNEIETNGWYNLGGGAYVTDPLDFDSDDDGLSDGEEKLFDTDPLNDEDPGIYVRYEDDFLTKEYFSATDPAYLSAVQGGDGYLMTEALVVRRGTTFYVGAPADADLTISGSGLSNLPREKEACGTGWKVTVPSNGTVGTYTLTLSRDGWSESMPLYVIFEIPSDLTQEQVAAFLYDDDPSNLRDETSVWFYAPEYPFPRSCSDYDPPCSFWDYGVTRGLAQAFWTDQFKKYVFLNYAMPAIEGQTSRSSAATAVANQADKEFRVNFSRGGYASFSSAMYKWKDTTGGITMAGGACESNANVFTTMLRSVGIPARPFFVDWNKTPGHGEITTGAAYEYDHSVFLWLGGRWEARRSYATSESGDLYYPWQHGITFEDGIYNYYGDKKGDVIISANEGWDYDNYEDPNNRGMVNYLIEPRNLEKNSEYLDHWDYRWHSIRPLEIKRSPYVDVFVYERWHGDNWAPVEWDGDPTTTYYLPPGVPNPADPLENWPYSPVSTQCSPVWYAPEWGEACPFGGGTLGTLDVTIDGGQTVLSESPVMPQIQWNLVQLREVVDDRGVDLDGNGRFDELVLDVEVYVAQPGTYTFGGTLAIGEQLVEADYVSLDLAKGVQTIQLSFDGYAIGQMGANGPYPVVELWVTGLQEFDRAELWDNILHYQQPGYETASYTVDQFESGSFTNVYTHHGVDTDGDGSYEALVVEVGLDVSPSGTYQVEGDLYDAEGNFLGHATWTGAGSPAALQFEVAETKPPFTLEHLTLIDLAGPILDSRHVKAHVITDLGGMIEQGALSVGGGGAKGDISAMQVTPTNAFTTTTVDTNGNGRYDKLVVKVGVNVTDAGGNYRIEGLLVDEYGTPVAWSVSDPQTLDLGNQELKLVFDGRILHDHMPFSPATQSLKLVAVKIFSGKLRRATLEDEVQVATTTPAYSREDFEPTSFGTAAFEDDMENGAITENNWTDSGPWQLVSDVWHSRSHAWMTSQSGNLNTIALDLSDYGDPMLRFSTCYDMGSSSAGYLEVSVNGGPFTRLATYDDSVASWVTKTADLSNFDSPNVRVRFKANSGDGLQWYVDDVFITGWGDDDGDGTPTIDEDLNGDGDPTNDDSDGDGVPDYLEPNNGDTDGDGTNDYLDPDDDGDGIPTADEDVDGDGSPVNDDSDSDGLPDYLDPDDDGDGIPTADEDVNGDGDRTNDDSDGDGTPNYLDADDDGDGVPTADEDVNGDGDPTNDHSDIDGTPDYLDPDDDNDGVPTADEDVNGDGDPTNDNSDGDGRPDYLDPDDDNDGVPTADEDFNGDGDRTNDDSDGDGTPNYLDTDDDGDGIDTDVEGRTPDADGDHVPDYLEPNDEDTDGDGTNNHLDADDDGDGVPTADEDWNQDGNPTNDDGNDNGVPDYLDPEISEAPIWPIYLPLVIK